MKQTLWRAHAREIATGKVTKWDNASTDREFVEAEMATAKQACLPGHEHWIEPDPVDETPFIVANLPAPKVEVIGNCGCRHWSTAEPISFLCVNRFGTEVFVGQYGFSKLQAQHLHSVLGKAIGVTS